jgi:glutamyl-tRNA synthetase
MNWGNAIVTKISHSINPLHPKLVTGVEMELHLQGDVKKTKKKITWYALHFSSVPTAMLMIH